MTFRCKESDLKNINGRLRKVFDSLVVSEYRATAQVERDVHALGANYSRSELEACLHQLEARGLVRLGGTAQHPTWIRAEIVAARQKDPKDGQDGRPEPSTTSPGYSSTKALEDDALAAILALSEALGVARGEAEKLRGACVAPEELAVLRDKAAKYDAFCALLPGGAK